MTPYYSISNPFPNGFNSTPGNLPHAQAQAALIGGSLGGMPLEALRYPYQGQWNFTVQRQLPGGAALEAAYAGSRGVHLPTSGLTADALPPQLLSMGNALNTLVANPFYGLVQTGTLSAPTVTQAQLLLPFPEYTGVSEAFADVFDSNYHALQMKVEKRFSHGGTVLASYTFSKLLADVSSLTGWLDSGVGAGPGIQNPYNLRAEKTLSGFDSRSASGRELYGGSPVRPGPSILEWRQSRRTETGGRMERERNCHLPGRFPARLDRNRDRQWSWLRPAPQCGRRLQPETQWAGAVAAERVVQRLVLLGPGRLHAGE